MLVDVPAGLVAGDEMCVVAFEGEQELVVVVPPGCSGGDTIEVCVPAVTTPGFVDVELPPSSRPGERVEVTIDGSIVSFFVPEDCVPGSPVRIEIPVEEGVGQSSDEHTGNAPASSTLPEHTPPEQTPPQCKFWAGLEVEVLRTSGRRTFGTVEAADWASATYTVKMNDGQMKYMVEEADLEHLWAGKYRTGDSVTVRMGRRSREGRVASHDDDDGTYGIIFGDGETVDRIKRTSISQQASPGMD
jgi:hypothetical protein